MYPPPPSTLSTAIGAIPGSNALAHVGVEGNKEETSGVDTGDQESSTVICIGAGLPPVPQKLVKRIQAGEFIDMSELLPDRLGINAGPPLEGDKESKQTKRRQVANILEWVQCFSVFTAVRTQKCPEKTQDLLGYLAPIVEARMEYEGDGWLGYDRRFRQNAAASLDTTWARIDPTLWNMAFVGQAKVSRCKHCFSLTHTATDCNWAPSPSTLKPYTPRPTGSSRPSKICYEWNHSPSQTCPFPACRYQHICTAARTLRPLTYPIRPCTVNDAVLEIHPQRSWATLPQAPSKDTARTNAHNPTGTYSVRRYRGRTLSISISAKLFHYACHLFGACLISL